MSDLFQQLYSGEAAQREGVIETRLEVDPENLAYGAQALLGAVYGYMMYNWYPGWVLSDEVLFPIRQSGVCAYDKEWGSETSEIVAWRRASFWLLTTQGWTFMIWLLNTWNDNEGGSLHKAFYQTQRVMVVAPLINLIFALQVQKSYAPAYAFYIADVNAQSECNEKWLFNEQSIDQTERSFLESSTRSRIWNLYTVTLLSALVSFISSEKLGTNYAKAMEMLAEDEHEEDHEEDAEDMPEENDEFAQEDNFF